jgi:DNA-binding XRE family transcriptional regulator
MSLSHFAPRQRYIIQQNLYGICRFKSTLPIFFHLDTITISTEHTKNGDFSLLFLKDETCYFKYMETIKFPNRLKEYRQINGLSQKQVAFLLGFKNTARIAEWEKGTAFPGILNLLKLSLIYHTLVNDLYFDLLQEFKEDLTQKQEVLFVSKR